MVMELRTYYRKLNMEQRAELARRVGTSPMYLLHIGCGNKRASLEMAVRIEMATHGAVDSVDVRPDLSDLIQHMRKK